MRHARFVGFLMAMGLAGSVHVLVRAQNGSQNINLITGSSDQFIGDQFRQRQNEPVFGSSSVNPAHLLAAYNDYRTVDYANDTGVGTPSPIQTLLAKLREFFTAPWRRGPEREGEENEEAERAAAAQAWIGLSFSDNSGKDWYTGLLPGHPYGQSAADYASPLRTLGLQAASDPVLATTPSQFFVGGIAFTPNGPSAGFVARFTDRNNTETGQNIQYDWTKLIVQSSATQAQFVDKPSVAAGPNGHVYVAFVVFDQADPQKLSSKIQVYRSANFGETWAGPVTVSDPLTRNQAPWLVVDPNNETTVYIGWRVFAAQTGGFANAIVGRKSTNGAASFTPAVPYPVALLLKAFDQPQGSLPQTAPVPRSNAYPTAAIDGNGAIHVALQEYVNPTTGLPLVPGVAVTSGVPRITVTSSYNGGQSWTLRKAVDLGPGAGTQFMPVLTAVGESGTSCAGQTGPRSRVMLMYYDARSGGVGTAPGTTGYVAGGTRQFDVRIAQASACTKDNAGRLVFGASEQLSQYTRSAGGAHPIVPTADGLGFTAVNRAYSMFCGGNCAFTGDYIHLAPRVPYVLTPTGWKLTTASGVDKTTLPTPVVQGVWADTRDAVLPTDGGIRQVPTGATPIDTLPWNVYAPPNLGALSCLNPGSRDQNVYGAEFAPDGLYAGAPQTFRVANIPHAYPVFVENRRGQTRLFKLTIDAAAYAAFNHTAFVTPNPASLDKDADIAVGPYSTVTGSVVIGPGQTAPVSITVAEVDATGTLVPSGATTAVTLFTAGDAAAMATETHIPIISPVPIVTQPFAGQSVFPFTVTAATPFTQNPFVQNPFSQNPFSQNPFSQNPFTQNPFTQNPFSQNPFSQNPFTQNPFAQNAASGTIYDVTDVSFLVANAGNEAAAFTTLLNIQNALQLQGSYLFQVLINRVSRTTGLEGCLAVDRSQSLQVSNIITPFAQNPFTQNPFTQNPFSQNPFSQNPFSQNPFSQNPFTQNPFTQNPFSQNTDPRDPAVSTSTFYLAPPATSGQAVEAIAPRPPAAAAPTLRPVMQREANGTVTTRLVQATGPTTTNYRADRPVDLILYTLRAYQIRPTAQIPVPLIPPGGPPRVGIVVAATTPNVAPQPGGGTTFDPGPPPVSGGGSAIPAKLAFVQPPTSTAPGAILLPAVQVAIQDGFGTTLTTSTLTVILALGTNTGGGTLAGTLTQPAINGLATFANLSINTAGTYTLVASSPSLTSATSDPFTVTAALVVTNTASTGPGSLRQAILNANAIEGALTPLITFNIPGAAPYVIAPQTALPTITRPVSIDGSTQPGYAGVPIIQLSGIATPAVINGLTITGGSSLVRGLAIGGFKGYGILLQTGGNNRIAGNYLGTNLAGTAPFDIGGDVILIQDSPDNVIGGTVGTTPGGPCTGDCNVIVARTGVDHLSGVRVTGNGVTSGGNRVVGNFVGTNASGSLGLAGASSFGVYVENAPNAAIGDGTAAGRNLVSGHNVGILLSASNALVAGNYVGTNAAGTVAITNGFGGGDGTASNVGIALNGADHAAVQGNVVAGNTGWGVGITGLAATGNLLRGNYIGLNAAGTAAIPNGFDGMFIIGEAHHNTIGGTTAAERNVISGNHDGGVVLGYTPGVTGNRIVGNYIGTNAAGALAVPNGGHGIRVHVPGNFIGGTAPGEGNVISGNRGSGVSISEAGAFGNSVQGNYIGTNATGTSALGNGTLNQFFDLIGAGVEVQAAPGNTVRGNLISGNGTGVSISGSDASGNSVLGNLIGTNASGSAPVRNRFGIFNSGAPNTIIGGTAPGERNVISGNQLEGVAVTLEGATGVTIRGNYIGTNAAGTAALGNGQQGITVRFGASTIIGGPGAGNVISGNSNTGIRLETGGNGVAGNFIGTAANGVAAVGNGGSGISIALGSENVIGGGGGEQANVIAFNSGTGVSISGGAGNRIFGNVFRSNTGLGIDLDDDGVTANDAGDGDTGSNDLQNYPVLTSATSSTVSGTLNSAASTTFAVQLFASPACSATGFGEGHALVRTLDVTTNTDGNASFSAGGLSLVPGQVVTATATDPSGNTSEFSACAPVASMLLGTFSDPAGDAGVGNPDLVSASVAVDGGSITLSARFAPGTFDSETSVTFSLDTDEDPSTGRSGINNLCSVDSGLIGWENAVQMGSTLYGTDAYLSRANLGCGSVTSLGSVPGVTYLSDGFVVTFPLTALSLVPDDGKLRFKVTTQRHISGTTFTGFLDVLPDVGQVPAVSGVRMDLDPVTFVAATGATSATGTLPNLGGPFTTAQVVGSVTFSLAPGGNNFSIGAIGTPAAPDWYAGLPGNDIALGFENFQATFAAPVHAAGFFFVEPRVTMPPYGGSPIDSTFQVTLYSGVTPVAQFTFNAPDDQVVFVSVSSGTAFDGLRITDTSGDGDDEYFGEFYTAP